MRVHTFMIRSGRKVPTPAIPIPDLAVPYAAPIPRQHRLVLLHSFNGVVLTSEGHGEGNASLWKQSVSTMRSVQMLELDRLLTMPKKGANLGV